MKYTITLQFTVEAETGIEAAQKAIKGEVQPNSIQTREVAVQNRPAPTATKPA